MMLTRSVTSLSSRGRTLAIGALIAAAATSAGLTTAAGWMLADRPAAGPVAVVAAPSCGCDASASKMSTAAAIEEARGAVFMIGTKGEDGGFIQIGTGFAVLDSAEHSVIATNAHVAQSVVEAQSSNRTVVARRPGIDAPEDFVIDGSPTLHPGYDRWQKVNERQPFAIIGEDVEQVNVLNPADVALLSAQGSVGHTLAIAPADDLERLQAGTDIVYLGFPAENIFGQKTNVPATADFGHIQSMSGVVLEPAAARSALTIQHDMTLTGGSSGGPIMVPDPLTGRLLVVGIHSASSFAFADGNRIPVGKAYGQRADYLRELIDGTAAAIQAVRDIEWAGELRGLTSALDKRMEKMERAILDRINAVKVLSASGNTSADRVEAIGSVLVDVRAGATYIIVVGSANWDELALSGRFNGETIAAEQRNPSDPLIWTAPDSGSLSLAVTSQTLFGDSSVELRVYEVRPGESDSN